MHMYIYECIYIYIRVCIYLYNVYIYISGHKWSTTHRALKSYRSKGIIYMYNHENNVPSQLSSQWLCGKSYTWKHRIHIPSGINLSIFLFS